jgi:hypothetical protein
MIRSHTAVATVLAAGALAAPSALARPADIISGNAGHSASATQRAGGSDLRSPDTRDAAQGRQIIASTPVKLVGTKQTSATGFDWGDAALGAGGAMGVVLVCLGGTLALTRRRHAPIATSKAARAAG